VEEQLSLGVGQETITCDQYLGSNIHREKVRDLKI